MTPCYLIRSYLLFAVFWPVCVYARAHEWLRTHLCRHEPYTNCYETRCLKCETWLGYGTLGPDWFNSPEMGEPYADPNVNWHADVDPDKCPPWPGKARL